MLVEQQLVRLEAINRVLKDLIICKMASKEEIALSEAITLVAIAYKRKQVPIKEWEYDIEEFPGGDFGTWLNSWGREGWELVELVVVEKNKYMFKRCKGENYVSR